MAFSKDVIDTINTMADEKGIEADALLAVVEVESGGRAFSTVNNKPMPLILYEYHVFYRYPGLTLDQRSEAVRRRLAARRWGDLPYAKSQTARYNQLARAAGINEQAAHAACSWGVGQVLGENADWLGYGTPKALADTAISGVRGQVEVMLSFITKRGLLDELAAHNWRAFARAYNGSGQVDFYSKRMASAYKRISGNVSNAPSRLSLRLGHNGEDVAALQRLLRGQGYSLVVDGDFGPATRRQVMQFQRENGLTADGIAGPATVARLEALSGQS